MRSEIHKLKPGDLEETDIEKSINHFGTNEPNETPIENHFSFRSVSNNSKIVITNITVYVIST
jgi:hypothetical protein